MMCKSGAASILASVISMGTLVLTGNLVSFEAASFLQQSLPQQTLAAVPLSPVVSSCLHRAPGLSVVAA